MMSYAATGAIGKSKGHVQVRAPCSFEPITASY